MFRSLLFFMIWASAAHAAPQTPAILVLGDSLSAGYGMDMRQGWVALLQRRLDDEGYRYRVINASISGDTTRGALSRLPTALGEHRPRVVIVELGGNDGLRGLPLTDMQRNLTAIVEKSQASGANVLIVGVRLPPNYGDAYVKKFHQVYSDVARAYRTPFVPFLLDGVGGRSELMQTDGLHPNPEAQRLMLENVWPQLRSVLKKE
jgi:acyl-CoA thioesterase I